MKKELANNSGPFNPDRKFEDFSKEFIVLLLRKWSSAHHIIAEVNQECFARKHSPEEVVEAELAVWLWLTENGAPRIARKANIQVNNLVDTMKVLQLMPTNIISGVNVPEIEIKDENHIILTITSSRMLSWFQKHAPHRIDMIYGKEITPVLQSFLNSIISNVEVNALKLPTQSNMDGIVCQWDISRKGNVGDANFNMIQKKGNGELTDYSGPYSPDLKFEDFSKDFLITLMGEYSRVYLQVSERWLEQIAQRHSRKELLELEVETWFAVGDRVPPMIAKATGVEVNHVVDAFKMLQVVPDNIIHRIYVVEFDIKNEDFIILTMKHCGTLLWFEKYMPHRIEEMCHKEEAPIIARYINSVLPPPYVDVIPIKLPPRLGPDDIACRFYIKRGEQ